MRAELKSQKTAFGARVVDGAYKTMEQDLGGRGWLIEVMKCIEMIGRGEFDIDDVYAFEQRLSTLYPGYRHVKPKIRQQLQVLRDSGHLEFVSRGRYRLASAL